MRRKTWASALALCGCLAAGDALAGDGARGVTAETRMEFAENEINRDSLMDVVYEPTLAKLRPGRRYAFETYFVREGIGMDPAEILRRYAEDTIAEDATRTWKFRLPQVIRQIHGKTITAVTLVNGREVCRDSLIYHLLTNP